MRQLLLGIALRLPDPWRPSEQGTMYIEAVDRLERAEHDGQEQLCVPLAPASTYWYYSDSRVIPIPAPLRAWWACDLG